MSYMGMGEITQADFAALDDLFERFIPSREEIWLFGTGSYARSFHRYLRECGVEADGFVVSSTAGQAPLMENKPVLCIEDFKERRKQAKTIGLLLTLDEKYYDEVLPNLMFMGDDLRFIKRKYKHLAIEKCAVPDVISKITFVLTAHCNFSCYSCAKAAPIAEAEFYDFKEFKRELKRFKELFNNVGEVVFSGGEPMLHPAYLDFLKEAREVYPDSKVVLLTNGIILQNLEGAVWKELANLRITVIWTKYPIEYRNFESAVEKAKRLGVSLHIDTGGDDDKKRTWRMPYSEAGMQKRHDFLFCRYHRNCAHINKGKYKLCSIALAIPYLNKRFETNIPIAEADEIDIYQATSEEIVDFSAKRPPLCDYCALRERRTMGEWLPSKGEKSEWFI